MGELPAHDTAHNIWNQLGDITKFGRGMATIAKANKAAAATLTKAVALFA